VSKKTKNRDLFDEYDSAIDGEPYGSKSDKKTTYVRCYESHPVIKLGKGLLYGGSCSHPMIDTADVYVGLDSWMNFKKPKYPWLTDVEGPEEVFFKISDACAPSDEANFILLIDWLAGKLNDGKSVHVGCIGGHGRTGMVLAALVKVMTGEEDAITWVRQNYCKKVVETKVQVKFLHQRFGIKEVEGSKSHAPPWTGKSSNSTFYPIEPKRAGPPSNGRTFSESWEDYIPGTTIERSRGPREMQPPKVTHQKSGEQIKPNTRERTITVTGLPNGPNSVW
jgi:hypothetical protein